MRFGHVFSIDWKCVDILYTLSSLTWTLTHFTSATSLTYCANVLTHCTNFPHYINQRLCWYFLFLANKSVDSYILFITDWKYVHKLTLNFLIEQECAETHFQVILSSLKFCLSHKSGITNACWTIWQEFFHFALWYIILEKLWSPSSGRPRGLGLEHCPLDPSGVKAW